MADPRDEEARRESKAILDRLEVESMVRGQTLADRLLRHFTAANARPDDKAELWGLRVGRALSAIFLVAMAVMLLRLLTG